jgi:dTDP-4-dehydrorhamnose 3,5-epimerase-like enzyme
LRAGSATYLRWFGAELNEDNRLTMYVPRGLGHGFIALTDNVETLYLNSAFYAPEAERGLRWNDHPLRSVGFTACRVRTRAFSSPIESSGIPESAWF